MAAMIPQSLIDHLVWTPEQPIVSEQAGPCIFIDAVLEAKVFIHGNMSTALSEALEYAQSYEMIVTLPEFISARVKAPLNDIWKPWYTILTEEDVGTDMKGNHYPKGTPVLVVMHGGGLLTPERLQQAYDKGLCSGSAEYRCKEFLALLEGKLAHGTSFPIYRIEEILKGASGFPHQFGVVMPYKTAKYASSGLHKKCDFLKDPLVMARAAGSLDCLEEFFDTYMDSGERLGNYHPFAESPASIPHGRYIIVASEAGRDGFCGDVSLYNDGCFMAVQKYENKDNASELIIR